MHFEWDDKKNAANIRKHGIDFADAEELFSGERPFLLRLILRAVPRRSDGEESA
jgi:uncharacterized DUF497 family protein